VQALRVLGIESELRTDGRPEHRQRPQAALLDQELGTPLDGERSWQRLVARSGRLKVGGSGGGAHGAGRFCALRSRLAVPTGLAGRSIYESEARTRTARTRTRQPAQGRSTRGALLRRRLHGDQPKGPDLRIRRNRPGTPGRVRPAPQTTDTVVPKRPWSCLASSWARAMGR
jgi:hypothetical protein